MFKPLTLAYSLEKKILLDAPVEKVWLTYRDCLPKLVRVMPTVDEIKVVSREETKDEVRLLNKWKISGGLPSIIKNLVPTKLLSYNDAAVWNQNEYVCYFTETPIDGSEIYKCVGKNTFLEQGNKTLLTISFELIIHPEKIPGVPSFIAKSIAPKIEKIISKEVVKNLASTSKVVEKHISKS